MENIVIIKKDGTREPFNGEKIVVAVGKSAARILVKLTKDEEKAIVNHVKKGIEEKKFTEVPIAVMHNLVEAALVDINEQVAKSYRDYRNYKQEFVHMMDEVFVKSQSIRYIGDKENANTDSSLVATKRSLIFNELNKELYRKFFMNREELQACKDGYIYVHDQNARLDTFNCCLADISAILSGGFEMGNVWYNEPKSLDTAWDVLGDVILSTAAQQYGGFTVPEVDKIMAPYAEKSYSKYLKEYQQLITDAKGIFSEENAQTYALAKVQREMEQGYQGIEYKLNTVGSSRGDYPFVTFTFGLGTNRFEKMCSITILNVHKEGQGKKGYKRPVLFPKLVFLYDKNIHEKGKECEDVFEAGLECSAKTMYPDWLSLTGSGYVPSMYKKYGRIVSPMGCRAFLSPWYERGGMEPADENDKPVFVGRCNLGAVSLHLPMILAKARRESKDFYEVLDYYLELIRNLHKRTYDYLGELRASVNPIMFCEGGMYGGHLKPKEKIRKLLPPMTMSYGITALNELQELYNGKSLVEDNKFALEVMLHINDMLAKYKKEDHILYAVYGTPAENLCFTGDTVVKTVYGEVPIKNLREGDVVFSYNHDTREVEHKKVLAAKKTGVDTEVVEITFDNGEKIRCTPGHRFAVKDRKSIKWVKAKFLYPGEKCMTKDGECTFVSSKYLPMPEDVYNIEVEDNHNFYVGNEGILVHNCGLQVKQFRKEFGIVKNVSDRDYVSNSFHCHVTENISPIEKQNLEYDFWNLFNGGKIQYVRYPLGYNVNAIRTLVLRAMDMGYYEGVNLALSYCDDCGYQSVDMGDSCPICGSKNLTKIDRMNGYLAYSRRNGDTRLNKAKMAEIAERKSM